ncbi:MAG: hypothetical protein Q7T82_00040 [Armatimonadota bacterium]|nr:hypothetical protein [Armatimonadota bacterium]
MRKSWFAVIIPGALALGAGAFVLALLLVKSLWAWTMPDLFPGAVEQGLIARDISWLTAFKVAIFFGVLVGISGASKKGHQ